MKGILTAFLILLPIFNIVGQNLVIETFYNHITIPNISADMDVAGYYMEESHDSKPSFSIYSSYHHNLNSKIKLKTAIGFSYIKFERSINIMHRDGRYVNQPIGFTNASGKYFSNNGDAGTSSILSLTIPFSVLYKLYNERVFIGVGVENHFRILSSQIKSRPLENEPSSENYLDNSGSGLNNYGFSVNMELQFNLIRSLNLIFQYSHFFTDVYDSNYQFMDNAAKYKMLKFGFNYNLKTLPKKNEPTTVTMVRTGF